MFYDKVKNTNAQLTNEYSMWVGYRRPRLLPLRGKTAVEVHKESERTRVSEKHTYRELENAEGASPVGDILAKEALLHETHTAIW